MYLILLEIMAFIVSLISLRMNYPLFRWICGILLLTVINEGILVPYFKGEGMVNNVIFYNVFSLADMTVWSIIFYKIHEKRSYKIFTAAAYALFMLYSLIELVFINGWHQFHTDSFRVYNICIIISAIFYFYEKLREVYHNLLTDPLFWVAAACFLYHSLLFVNFTTLSQTEYWKTPNAARFYFILQDTASTFYYFLLSCSFLVCYFSYYRRAQT